MPFAMYLQFHCKATKPILRTKDPTFAAPISGDIPQCVGTARWKIATPFPASLDSFGSLERMAPVSPWQCLAGPAVVPGARQFLLAL